MSIDKLRFRFRKSGDLRFLSHHDLMRAVERLLRRANIPFRSSSGFNPRPRLVFPLSLPLGVIGLREVMELELTEPRDPEATRSLLQAHAPQGLEFLSARRIPLERTGQVVQADYRLAIPPDQAGEIADRCLELLAQAEVFVERPQPPAPPKRVDIRPFILRLGVVSSGHPHDQCESAPSLHLSLRVTPTGSARAPEVIRCLGAAGLLETGAILERTNLLLLDELPVSDSDTPPTATPAGSGISPCYEAAVSPPHAVEPLLKDAP